MVRKASERAASLGASEEAQRYAERAIELTDGPLAAAELHERAGMMAWVRVDVDSATEHFRTAIELFEAEGATHPVARVSARLGEVVWSQGRGIDALESMAASYRVLADEEPDADLAQLAAQLGRFTFFNGETERAMEWIERSLEIAEALDLQEILSDALNTKSLVMLTFGRASEATGLMRHALAIALEHDKPTAAQRAYNNLADLSDYDDRYPEAERMVGEGLSLSRRVGNWYWESSLLGHVYPKYALGRWDDLMASLDEIPTRRIRAVQDRVHPGIYRVRDGGRGASGRSGGGDQSTRALRRSADVGRRPGGDGIRVRRRDPAAGAG